MAPHPDHGSVLRVSGPASPSVIAWGYGLGLAILLLMTSCILLGVAKAGRLGRLGLGLAAGCFGLALVFTALVFTYARGASGLVAGFPLPTAWMLYGVWGFPSLMVLGFSWAFLRVWLTEDEVDRFRAALAERRGEPER